MVKKIKDVYLQTLEDWAKSKCWMSEMMDKGGGKGQKTCTLYMDDTIYIMLCNEHCTENS